MDLGSAGVSERKTPANVVDSVPVTQYNSYRRICKEKVANLASGGDVSAENIPKSNIDSHSHMYLP